MINQRMVMFSVWLVSLLVVPAVSQDYIIKICSTTDFSAFCKKVLAPYAVAIGTDPGKLAIYGTIASLSQTQSLQKYVAGIKVEKDEILIARVQNCNELLIDAVDYNTEALEVLKKLVPRPPPGQSASFQSGIDDVITKLSVCLADADTCSDGLDDVAGQGGVKSDLRNRMNQLMEYQGLALAFVDKYRRA